MKTIELSKPPTTMFCTECGYRMYSKGIRTRTVNHQVLQDGFQLRLLLRQRKYRCTNPSCRHIVNETFNFVSPRKRNTDMQDMLIVEAFRNPNASAASIAKRFHVSDTYALQVFEKYVNMPRLPLSQAISIDEVHLDMGTCKYALVIYDLIRGEPIDILPGRTTAATETYFSEIPLEERNQVKYLVTDMYAPYLKYVKTYFYHAQSVVDSFHVIQTMNHSIDTHIKKILQETLSRDHRIHKQRELDQHRQLRFRQSDEAYLLKHHKWVLLQNPDNINYKAKSKIDRHFHHYMDTYSYVERFLKIHPSFPQIFSLKAKYHAFNTECVGSPQKALPQLTHLIEEYESSENEVFQHFAKVLKKHKKFIIQSFTIIQSSDGLHRLSNGPIESFNRIPKDMRRIARGYRNFDHVRNRILYATRVTKTLQG